MKMYLILILESVGFDPALGYVTQEWQLSGISCWLCCSGSSSPGCDKRCWCLPKNDALRKGCKECLQIFSASSILFKVCFVKIWGSVPSFWIPNSYFFNHKTFNEDQMTSNSVYLTPVWKAHFLPGSPQKSQWKSLTGTWADTAQGFPVWWSLCLRIILELVQEMEWKLHVFP